MLHGAARCPSQDDLSSGQFNPTGVAGVVVFSLLSEGGCAADRGWYSSNNRFEV